MATSLASASASAPVARLRPRGPVRAHRLFLAAGAVLLGVYFALPADAQEFAYLVFPAAAVAAIVLGTRTQLVERRLPWYLIGAGQLCFGIGDAIWDTYDFVAGPTPFPSVADPFYLAGYPLLGAGVFLLVHRLCEYEGRWPLIDTAIVTIAFALLQWTFLIDPSLDAGGSLRERAVAAAYPIGDVLLLGGLARFFVTPVWRTSSYRLLLASGAVLLAADVGFGLSPDPYPVWADGFWIAAYLLVGAAALAPSMAALTTARTTSLPRLSPLRLAVLAGGLVTAPVVLLVERDDFWLVVGGALLLAALVLARVVGLVRALDALRTRVEHQNERLRELDRLKDELVSSVGHDLRSPLVTIAGFAELLREDAVEPEARRHLDVVERNARRLLGMVDDLMLAATLRAGALELSPGQVDLAAEARACVEALLPRARAAGVDLALDAEPVPPVRGDRERLAQALDNLVGNAVKFTPAGGSVLVRVAAGAGTVAVEVADNGVGIPDAERAHVFQRFFRASTARGVPGSGLGLHIVHGIVGAHGGRLSLESAEGAGTIVRAELPQAGAQ